MMASSVASLEKAVDDLAAFTRNLLAEAEHRLQREPLVARAERIYQMRRRRAEIFGDQELFGEPAYDILLDLYIAAGRQRRVSVSSSCIGADVPSTTALRHVRILEERGFVVRTDDPFDKRRHFLELTPRAVTALETFLSL